MKNWVLALLALAILGGCATGEPEGLKPGDTLDGAAPASKTETETPEKK